MEAVLRYWTDCSRQHFVLLLGRNWASREL